MNAAIVTLLPIASVAIKEPIFRKRIERLLVDRSPRTKRLNVISYFPHVKIPEVENLFSCVNEDEAHRVVLTEYILWCLLVATF